MIEFVARAGHILAEYGDGQFGYAPHDALYDLALAYTHLVGDLPAREYDDE